MSSLLSAYLDIWPDSHCKEGQSGDFKDGKKATERRRNGTDIAETTTGGNQLFERENKAKPSPGLLARQGTLPLVRNC